MVLPSSLVYRHVRSRLFFGFYTITLYNKFVYCTRIRNLIKIIHQSYDVDRKKKFTSFMIKYYCWIGKTGVFVSRPRILLNGHCLVAVRNYVPRVVLGLCIALMNEIFLSMIYERRHSHMLVW